ncbi:MAG: YciI family protein [Geodermatophilaceae bacterium]
MAQYAVLIYSDESEVWTPEQDQEVMDAYWAYSDMLSTSGKGNGGEALHPTSTATTVRVRDGKTLTTDGPFVESKEALGGFYIVQADDLDGAIELAAQCPGAKYGAIEVRPVVDFSAGPAA